MKKQVKQEDLINWWLEKYHNTNLDKILDENPKWKENPEKYSLDFFNEYQVTQDQHDEWLEWAKAFTKAVTGIKGRMFDRSWGWVYLDTSPKIKEDEK